MNEPLVEYNIQMPKTYMHPEDLATHLGGHEGETHIDEGALEYLIQKLNVKSMIDIGCGPGGMVELGLSKGLDVLGVDGDFKIERGDNIKDRIMIHDYASGPFIPDWFDLGWSVEFVEHVDKPFMPNFLETFKRCRYVAMTHALPGQPGHHHVNCMPIEYWIGAMEAIGFTIMVDETNEMRKASTMRERYIRQQGYLFKNGRVPSL
ncbi:class I SAM-dependent methyltransferase [bacterium]|nr:class I SAM-dependent methyltransferase [Candidatus Elulimicrobium humile]